MSSLAAARAPLRRAAVPGCWGTALCAIALLLVGCGKPRACRIADVYGLLQVDGQKGLSERDLSAKGVRLCARHLGKKDSYKGADLCSHPDEIFPSGELLDVGSGDSQAFLLVRCPSVNYPRARDMQRVTCGSSNSDSFFYDDSEEDKMMLFFDGAKDPVNCETQANSSKSKRHSEEVLTSAGDQEEGAGSEGSAGDEDGAPEDAAGTEPEMVLADLHRARPFGRRKKAHAVVRAEGGLLQIEGQAAGDGWRPSDSTYGVAEEPVHAAASSGAAGRTAHHATVLVDPSGDVLPAPPLGATGAVTAAVAGGRPHTPDGLQAEEEEILARLAGARRLLEESPAARTSVPAPEGAAGR